MVFMTVDQLKKIKLQTNTYIKDKPISTCIIYRPIYDMYF